MPTMKDLQEQLAEAQAQLAELEKPVYPSKKFAGGRQVFNPERTRTDHAYWAPDDKEDPRRKAFELPDNYKPYQHFKSFGEQIRCGMSNPLEHRERHLKAVQGMSESIGSDGGFTVLPEFSPTILEKVYANDIFSRTDGYTVTGNGMTFPRNAESSRANGSRHGGLRGYWVGEGDPMTGSKPKLGELQLKLKKLAVIVYLTQELLDDTGKALEQYVGRKASDEFQFMLGDAVFNGTGAGQPQGCKNSPAKVSVSARPGQAARSIVYENILDMYSRLSPQSMKSALWYINQDCIPSLSTMSLSVGTGGLPVYLPPTGAAGAPYGMLMGRPIEITEFQETVGTEGDIVLADLGQYVTITKGGITQAVSMHVEFLTDQLALRFTMRVDGGTWEASPITPYKGTNTQSSFVTLATR